MAANSCIHVHTNLLTQVVALHCWLRIAVGYKTLLDSLWVIGSLEHLHTMLQDLLQYEIDGIHLMRFIVIASDRFRLPSSIIITFWVSLFLLRLSSNMWISQQTTNILKATITQIKAFIFWTVAFLSFRILRL